LPLVAHALDACADGDAVSDGDLLRADEDVLDEQSQHASGGHLRTTIGRALL